MSWAIIGDVPKDKVVSDAWGWTWSYRHGVWGFRVHPDGRWLGVRSETLPSTASFGPFQEVTL